MVMRKQHGGGVQVFRITGARTGLAEDVRGRQRRYVISMSVRTVSVILAASLWNVERYVAIVALVLGAVLPYIAVVVANAGRERPPSLPSTFVTTPLRPMIAAPSAEDQQADSVRDSAPRDVPTNQTAGAGGERPDPV
ncbi:membrane protein [Streptomyces eurythermus]|nr:membrane protein [Streptomyces eurythermus]